MMIEANAQSPACCLAEILQRKSSCPRKKTTTKCRHTIISALHQFTARGKQFHKEGPILPPGRGFNIASYFDFTIDRKLIPVDSYDQTVQ
jgi:hypothetical protein